MTVRQKQIIGYVARGYTNARIGNALGLKEDTIKSHLRNLYRRCDARDRAHLVALTVLRGQFGEIWNSVTEERPQLWATHGVNASPALATIQGITQTGNWVLTGYATSVPAGNT